MTQKPVNWKSLNVDITDISTAASVWVVSPWDGYIKEVWTVISAAITTADATVGLELGGTAVTGSTVTIAASGSAAGTVDSAFPTALNYVTAGQAIEVVNGGESDTTSRGTVTIVIET